MSAVAGDAGQVPGDTPAAPAPDTGLRYQRIAWITLAVALVLFCGVVGAALWGARVYGARASDPRTAVVQLAHGTKLSVQRFGQKAWTDYADTTVVGEGDSVRTGQDTDAWITLFDQSTVHLFYSSTVTLRKMQSSRFLNQFKDILIEQSSGAISLAAGARAPYASDDLAVATADGQIVVAVPENSTALVNIVDPPVEHLRVTVSTLLGKTYVRAGGGPKVEIPRQEMCRVFEDATILGPQIASSELVENGDFKLPGDVTNNPGELSPGWQITPRSPDSQGIEAGVVSETLGGQVVYAARFARPAGATDLATVSIRQEMDKPVNYYQSVDVAAAVKIADQSPIGGGLYPLTLRVTYDDLEGTQGIWERDFYARPSNFAPGPNAIPLVSAIWTDMPPAAGGPWDLMSQSPPPARIKAVEIIVTGYSFNASVTGISLTAH
jgi:hypothetical protein